MKDLQQTLSRIQADARYQTNVQWGEPRSGHPEGAIAAHIAELEGNLRRLQPRLSAEECSKLRLLIHVHDTFKPEAETGVAISHPASHASLARKFLQEFCDDECLAVMVQLHDEPYALWRQVRSKGTYNQQRFDALLDAVSDWSLFCAFCIVDGCTAGKSRAQLEWLFAEIGGKVESRFTAADIIAPEPTQPTI